VFLYVLIYYELKK